MSEHDISLASIILAAGAALLNIILVPLSKAAARGEVQALITDHNENADAHPNLDHARSLEEALTKFSEDTSEQFTLLRKEIADLRVDLARSGKLA